MIVAGIGVVATIIGNCYKKSNDEYTQTEKNIKINQSISNSDSATNIGVQNNYKE